MRKGYQVEHFDDQFDVIETTYDDNGEVICENYHTIYREDVPVATEEYNGDDLPAWNNDECCDYLEEDITLCFGDIPEDDLHPLVLEIASAMTV